MQSGEARRAASGARSQDRKMRNESGGGSRRNVEFFSEARVRFGANAGRESVRARNQVFLGLPAPPQTRVAPPFIPPLLRKGGPCPSFPSVF